MGYPTMIITALKQWMSFSCTWCQSDEKALIWEIEGRGWYCSYDCASKCEDHELNRRKLDAEAHPQGDYDTSINTEIEPGDCPPAGHKL